MDNRVASAISYATQKHGDQKYGEYPYIYHLSKVASLAKYYGLSTEDQIVAALHDILEDTGTSYDEILENFGEHVANTVLELTRHDDEIYMEYIERVSKNISAKRVKICDLLHNLEESIKNPKYSGLKIKYQSAIFFLSTN